MQNGTLNERSARRLRPADVIRWHIVWPTHSISILADHVTLRYGCQEGIQELRSFSMYEINETSVS